MTQTHMASNQFDPLELGAKGDGKALDTKAVQGAIDNATAAGGGTVVLRGGKTYLVGSLVLKSNVTLHVEGGSLLKCSPNWDDLTEHWPGGPQEPTHHGQVYSRVFLSAHRGTTNVSITGTGIIDGSGEAYRGKDTGTSYEYHDYRPFLLFWVGVTGVTLRDVTLKDSGYWTLRLSGCEDIIINGIRIRGDMKMRNCDGIDLDRCRRARVSDCDIICPDDAISIKGCREFEGLGDCEDIVVSNCTLVSKSSALVVGCDASCPLRNITFTNCVVRDSNRGLSLNLSEDSLYENILFSNIIVETRICTDEWWGRGEPIYISCTPWFDKVGRISNVRFQNILARSECGVYIAADELGQVSNVVLDNVRVEIGQRKGARHAEEVMGMYDRRPTSGERQVYKPEEGIAGFHLENIQNVKIRNSEVVWLGQEEWMGNALWAEGCKGLKYDVDGEAGRKGLEAIVEK